MTSSVYGMLEAASRTLAPTKSEMEVVIATELRLSEEEKANPAYLHELREAQIALEQSADVPSFLSRLKGEPATPPRESKLKTLLWCIIAIPVFIVLATLNDIVRAVAPLWFQCLWGLC